MKGDGNGIHGFGNGDGRGYDQLSFSRYRGSGNGQGLVTWRLARGGDGSGNGPNELDSNGSSPDLTFFPWIYSIDPSDLRCKLIESITTLAVPSRPVPERCRRHARFNNPEALRVLARYLKGVLKK